MNGSPDKPDLDCRDNIRQFVQLFYQQLLADAQLAPIFLEVARIDLAEHLPRITDYWCKLLLGQRAYQRHTMSIHRQLHLKRPLHSADFQRWLACFTDTVDRHFAGERAERAKRLAGAIATNMRQSLPAADRGESAQRMA